MKISRRKFLGSNTAVLLASALPGNRSEAVPRVSSRCPAEYYDSSATSLLDPKQMRLLTQRGIDAARSVGATYADVRLTRTVTTSSEHVADQSLVIEDREYLAVGIRALVNGQWGFAASPYWNSDELTRLAQAAVAQARENAKEETFGSTALSRRWTTPRGELVQSPVTHGQWTMPGIDPFTISIEERNACMMAWMQAINEARVDPVVGQIKTNAKMDFKRQERVFASTENAWTHQIVYETTGEFSVTVKGRRWAPSSRTARVHAQGLFPQGKGWELFLENNPREQLPALLAQGAEQITLSSRDGQIGRFDAVFDAVTMARLISATFGTATQLDRALGYETNMSGTSYLGPEPLSLLGTLQVASPLVTVLANRIRPGGSATVRWDDEGVETHEFPLVHEGILFDYQTTREQATWLAPWYAKEGRPIRSHACAASPSALAMTMQHSPNFSLAPSATSTSLQDLIKDTKQGIAVIDGVVYSDFQAKTGTITGTIREIVNGTLGDILQVAILFDSSDLWKKLVALGGQESVGCVATTHYKGEPEQAVMGTTEAVPAKFTQVSVIRG